MNSKLARKRQEALERRRKQQAGGGGGGGGGGAWSSPIEINGQKYWRPYGIPDAEDSDKPAPLAGGETWLKTENPEMPGILMDSTAAVIVALHGVNSPRDRSVLDKRHQKYAHYKKYPCTHDDEAGPRDMEDWEPSEDWVDTEEGEYILDDERGTGFEVRVVEEGDAITLIPPSNHLFVDPDISYATFESVEHAKFVAEQLLAEALSCIYCAEFKHEKDEDVKWKDLKAFPAQETGLIPFFALIWHFGEKPEKGKDTGRLSAHLDEGQLLDEPGKRDDACRQGWGWLASPVFKSGKSSIYRTWENYHTYLHHLHSQCSNCLGTDGEIVGRKEHVIDVEAIMCPHCGFETYSGKDMRRLKVFAEPEIDENGVEAKAGIYQLINYVPTECPECSQTGVGVPRLACSSCDSPTPLLAHQVITTIRRDADGGFYDFELFEDPKTGRIFHPDWNGLLATTDGVPVEKFIRPGIKAASKEKFEEFLNMVSGGEYPLLSIEKQARFLGASCLDVHSKNGTPRTRRTRG